MSIDILVPVLGRPQNAQPLVDSIDRATLVPHVTIFIATRGDDEQIEACKATGCVTLLVDPGRSEYARKINLAAASEFATGEFLLTGADDLRFHRDWDRAAIDRFHETGKPVVGTNDLGNATVMKGLHSTHTIVHRSYLELGTIDDPTKLLHEGYDHNWVDNEFIATASHRDMWTFAAHSRVEHLHPFWKKSADDAVYERGRASYHRDARLFRKRQKLWR